MASSAGTLTDMCIVANCLGRPWLSQGDTELTTHVSTFSYWGPQFCSGSAASARPPDRSSRGSGHVACTYRTGGHIPAREGARPSPIFARRGVKAPWDAGRGLPWLTLLHPLWEKTVGNSPPPAKNSSARPPIAILV